MEEEGWPWKIPLTKNKVVVDWALCSEEDYEALSRHKWHKNKDGYVKTGDKIHGQTSMSRVVKHGYEQLPIIKGTVVDHIDGDRSNNKRENLFVATLNENAQNRKKSKGEMTSPYIGVNFSKASKKFISRIAFDKKRITIGYYDTDVDAAKARDIFILQKNALGKVVHHKLNFPHVADELLKTPSALKLQSGVGKKYFNVARFSAGLFIARLQIHKKEVLRFTCKSEIECANVVDAFIVEKKLDKPLNFPEQYLNYVPEYRIKIFGKLIDDKTMQIFMKNSPDAIVLIDKEDYDKVKYLSMSVNSKGYVRTVFKSTNTGLNRLVLGVTDPSILVDHFDGNPLNNCKKNLRIATHQQNAENKKSKVNSKSKYVGVSVSHGKYVATVINRDFKYQKYYKIEEYAARDRDLVILKHFSDSFYKLNFEWTPFQIKLWTAILEKENRN